MPQILRSASHWGAFRMEVVDGRLKNVTPFEHDPAPTPLISAWPEMVTSPLRVASPVVRRGWRDGDAGAAQGEDGYIEIEWDEALDLIAGELVRVRRDRSRGSSSRSVSSGCPTAAFRSTSRYPRARWQASSRC